MNVTRLLVLFAAALLPATSFAGTESGFYLGAGIGQASVGDIDTPDVGDINFDGDDTGYKVFAGYNFGLIPLVDLAIEGGYVDFGKPDDTVSGVPVEVDVNAWDLFGLAGVNIGPVGVFAKMGLVMWDGDVTADGDTFGDDGTDPAYGIGARLKFGSLEVRAEYEYFDADAAGLDLISASGVWTF
jgi:outer membrane immunogenic protein